MMRDKEQIIDGKMRKQQVMDELLVSPTKQSVEYFVIVLKSGSKEVDNEDSVFPTICIYIMTPPYNMYIIRLSYNTYII